MIATTKAVTSAITYVGINTLAACDPGQQLDSDVSSAHLFISHMCTGTSILITPRAGVQGNWTFSISATWADK